MLILTRKTNQKLIINDNIEITVLEVNGNAVKIGINAPSDVSIYREEIYKEIQETNKQAQKLHATDVAKIAGIDKTKTKSFDIISKLKK